MAEAQQYVFSYKEIAEALIKKQEIHEGLWGIYIEFGFGAANINPTGGGEGVFVPAAIIPVQKIGIQRFDAPNSLTVDAAEINPLAVQPNKASSGGQKLRSRRQRKDL